jgi:hypothetical protein
MPISLRSSLRVIVVMSTVGQCAEALGLDGRAAGRVNGKLTAWGFSRGRGEPERTTGPAPRRRGHLDEANPVVQRLASSPEVAALFSHERLSSLPESGGFGLGGARARPSFPTRTIRCDRCTWAK